MRQALTFIFLTIFFVGCASIKNGCGPGNPGTDGPIVSVLVQSAADDPAAQQRMQAFDQALRAKIGDTPLGCIGCDQIGTTSSLDYTFYRDQVWLYKKFGLAWNELLAKPGGEKVTMGFYKPYETGPDCTTPQPCNKRSICTQTGGCAYSKTGPCRCCGTNAAPPCL